MTRPSGFPGGQGSLRLGKPRDLKGGKFPPHRSLFSCGFPLAAAPRTKRALGLRFSSKPMAVPDARKFLQPEAVLQLVGMEQAERHDEVSGAACTAQSPPHGRWPQSLLLILGSRSQHFIQNLRTAASTT